jgi:hypothetical protein
MPFQDPKIRSRIENWKFGYAKSLSNDVPGDGSDHDRKLLDTLSFMFGNCGWFEGMMGEMVEACVQVMLGEPNA